MTHKIYLCLLVNRRCFGFACQGVGSGELEEWHPWRESWAVPCPTQLAPNRPTAGHSWAHQPWKAASGKICLTKGRKFCTDSEWGNKKIWETVEGTPRPEEEKAEVLHVEQMSTLQPMKDAVLQHVDMPEGRCSPWKDHIWAREKSRKKE